MDNKLIEERKKTNKKIYSWIVDYLMKNGEMPTYEEIGKRFHFSKERARQKLLQLQDEGYLIKVGRKWRKGYTFTSAAIFKIKK